MKYSVLGPTGVRVSRICVGTATFGVAPSSQDADGVVGAALDLGINFFDTADVYGSTSTFDRPGAPPASERESAEEILGRALAGRRDEVVLATKSGERRFDPDAGLSRRYIIQQVEQSLRRLRTDRIDLYYAHFPDPNTPLEQTLAVYDDLIRQGKLRYVALSNHPAWQVTEALWIADDRRLVSAPVAAQVMYSLLDRSAEKELAAACVRFGLSIIPYAPLHGGLLADLSVLDRPIAGGKRYGGPGYLGVRDRGRPQARPPGPRVGAGNAAGLAGVAAVPPGRGLGDRRSRDHRGAPRQRLGRRCRAHPGTAGCGLGADRRDQVLIGRDEEQ